MFSPETCRRNSIKLFAGVLQYIIILLLGHELAQIDTKFLFFLLFILEKKVPTSKFLLVTTKNTYGRYQIMYKNIQRSQNGGVVGINMTIKVIFLSIFFSFFLIVYIFFSILFQRFYHFYSFLSF